MKKCAQKGTPNHGIAEKLDKLLCQASWHAGRKVAKRHRPAESKILKAERGKHNILRKTPSMHKQKIDSQRQIDETHKKHKIEKTSFPQPSTCIECVRRLKVQQKRVQRSIKEQ